jgi:hypothetical protein
MTGSLVSQLPTLRLVTLGIHSKAPVSSIFATICKRRMKVEFGLIQKMEVLKVSINYLETGLLTHNGKVTW